jgi:CBS domain-containing protein
MASQTAEIIGQVADSPICVVKPEHFLRQVIETMVLSERPLALVMRDEELVGVVSEGDVVRSIHDGADLDTIWAADIMTTDVVQVEEHTAAWDVLELMLAQHIRHVIVQREAGPGLVGFFNVVDLVLPRD